MTHQRAVVLSAIELLAGGVLMTHLMRSVSPYSDGEQIDPMAILAFLTAIFLLGGGAGSLSALALHRRWPALAGRKGRQQRKAAPALRQGILVGMVAATFALLAMTRVLDLAVLIVVLLLAGLVEAYVQSRG